MTGTGEGRLDTQSPMLTFQADDGSRVVMVLGGRGEHGISTHPRIAIRRFVLRHEGLDGLARRGLFPTGLVPQARGDGPLRVHGARQRSARRRQDDPADRAARRRVATRTHHHRREEPARTAPRRRPAPPGRSGAVHPSLERRRRRRDHHPPARRADPSAQSRPGRRRRARRGRGARHARRRVDVQARFARDDPRPHRRTSSSSGSPTTCRSRTRACPSSPCGA